MHDNKISFLIYQHFGFRHGRSTCDSAQRYAENIIHNSLIAKQHCVSVLWISVKLSLPGVTQIS